MSFGVDCGDIHAGAVGEVSSRGMGREGEGGAGERERRVKMGRERDSTTILSSTTSTRTPFPLVARIYISIYDTRSYDVLRAYPIREPLIGGGHW